MAFPSLFLAASEPEASVAANYDLHSHSWDVKFRRTFGSQDMECWEQMLLQLDPIFLSDQKDSVKWALEKDGVYSTRSM